MKNRSYISPTHMNHFLSVAKDRFVTSEVNYRREGRGGISERKLVNSLNKVAKQLAAPDFARVSVAQVRYLRINLLTVYRALLLNRPEIRLEKQRSIPRCRHSRRLV